MQYKCRSCGKEFNEKVKFCSKCGNEIKDGFNLKKECINCKREIEIIDMYCKYCGEKQEEKKGVNFSLLSVILSFMIIGPFCLIGLWSSKKINLRTKKITTYVILIVSLLIILIILKLLEYIFSIYQQAFSL